MKWLKRIGLLLTMPFFFGAITIVASLIGDTVNMYRERIAVVENPAHPWAKDFTILVHVPVSGRISDAPAMVYLRDFPEIRAMFPQVNAHLIFDDTWPGSDIVANTQAVYSNFAERVSPVQDGYNQISYHAKQLTGDVQEVRVRTIWEHDRNLYSWYRVSGTSVEPLYVYWEYPGLGIIFLAPFTAVATAGFYIYLFRRLNRRIRDGELALVPPVRQDGAN